ncbi:hypothetical protein [Pseudochelatococcus sp. G4_1912]|uniref:hypothetical protein n=1 Tax=Pseudochelatococcus sp. G4_1912 TaxID=3114288 RepID=UPI0039C6F230
MSSTVQQSGEGWGLPKSLSVAAAISFMAPLSNEEAARFWSCDVQPEVVAG